MKRFAFSIALALIFAGTAVAQAGSNPADAADLWSGYTFSEKMTGLETAKGTQDFEDDVIWGQSITMAGTSGEFTANIHRSGVKINSEWGNKIVGGTWTLHLYKGGELRGMLFGEFTGGMIQWILDKSGNVLYETVDGTLLITGGTGEFEGKGGPTTSGVMNSISDVHTKEFPLHTGSVSLLY